MNLISICLMIINLIDVSVTTFRNKDIFHKYIKLLKIKILNKAYVTTKKKLSCHVKITWQTSKSRGKAKLATWCVMSLGSKWQASSDVIPTSQSCDVVFTSLHIC